MFRLLRVGAALCICLFPHWAVAAGDQVKAVSVFLRHCAIVSPAGIVNGAEATAVQNCHRHVQGPKATAAFLRYGFRAR